MTTTVQAIYESGSLRLTGPLPLPEHTQVTVTICSDRDSSADTERASWLMVSEDALNQTWSNPDDDIFNELLTK